MPNLFKNQFVQALGWGVESILNILESFSRWYRYYGIKWAEEASIVFGALFLFISAVSSSK